MRAGLESRTELIMICSWLCQGICQNITSKLWWDHIAYNNICSLDCIVGGRAYLGLLYSPLPYTYGWCCVYQYDPLFFSIQLVIVSSVTLCTGGELKGVIFLQVCIQLQLILFSGSTVLNNNEARINKGNLKKKTVDKLGKFYWYWQLMCTLLQTF